MNQVLYGLSMKFVLIALLALFLTESAQAKTKFGLGDWSYPSSQDAARISNDGVRHWRASLAWSDMEIAPGQYQWAYVDELMRTASRTNLELILVFNGCPLWICSSTRNAPRNAEQREAFLIFLRAVVERYKPTSVFWQQQALRPVKTNWQIYNEVNVGADWPNPTARDYVALLESASKQIKSIDPNAKVISSGLAQKPALISGQKGTKFLQQLYRQQGFAEADVVAVHAYAKNPKEAIKFIKSIKQVMKRNRDSRPLWITEISWGSNQDAHAFSVGSRQAAMLLGFGERAMKERLARVYWFGLKDLPEGALVGAEPWSIHTGLWNINSEPKPSYQAFQKIIRHG